MLEYVPRCWLAGFVLCPSVRASFFDSAFKEPGLCPSTEQTAGRAQWGFSWVWQKLYWIRFRKVLGRFSPQPKISCGCHCRLTGCSCIQAGDCLSGPAGQDHSNHPFFCTSLTKTAVANSCHYEVEALCFQVWLSACASIWDTPILFSPLCLVMSHQPVFKCL